MKRTRSTRGGLEVRGAARTEAGAGGKSSDPSGGGDRSGDQKALLLDGVIVCTTGLTHTRKVKTQPQSTTAQDGQHFAACGAMY